MFSFLLGAYGKVYDEHLVTRLNHDLALILFVNGSLVWSCGCKFTGRDDIVRWTFDWCYLNGSEAPCRRAEYSRLSTA